MRCTAIAQYSGQRCQMFALTGEDKCVIHSQSEVAVKARQRPCRYTKRDMILELQRQLRNVKSSKAEPLEKSREIRALITQIDNLKDYDKPSKEKVESKEEDTFEDRVRKSMEKKEE